jgi:hypothetical protein
MHDIKIEWEILNIAKVKRVIKTRLTMENWSAKINDSDFKLVRMAQRPS